MPKTRYASSGDVKIAYQVLGDGPIDLVLIPGIVSHLELWWDVPDFARFYESLATFSRLILFDKRGTGMSDRDVGVATLEERMDDVRAVMDAAGSERAAIHGASEGGPMGALFAATFPERTTHLILYGTFPRVTAAPGWPGIPAQEFQRLVNQAVADFPATIDIERYAPSLAVDQSAKERWEARTRMSTSPGSLGKLLEMIGQLDVRAVLPTISVPTLIIHRREDRVTPFACAEYLASVIPGAELVPLPGNDHLPVGDTSPWVGAIEEFLTGSRHQPTPDRVLSTVVFTDIVDSTGKAARFGDAEWRRLLDRHDALLRQTATQFSGRVVKTLGDGGLVLFDGPARAARFASSFGGGASALGIQVRAGIHTGEVELRGEDVGGIAVHIAARISALAGPGEVLSSRTLKDLTAGSGLVFESRGSHALRGIPEEWEILAVSC